MKESIDTYQQTFKKLVDSIVVTNDTSSIISLHSGIETACGTITERTAAGGKIFFIGNGGSAAIASHMAIDFWTNGKMQAMAFNDSSLLTCISNDFGYQHVFEKPIEMFMNTGDVLFAISSSGRSENILRGVAAAQAKKCDAITFSGFAEDNPLRSKGMINFYVPSGEYGPVEVIHQYLCHFILDMLMLSRTMQHKKG